jgi:hypothetical protein
MPAQTRIANLKHKNDKAFLPLGAASHGAVPAQSFRAEISQE